MPATGPSRPDAEAWSDHPKVEPPVSRVARRDVRRDLTRGSCHRDRHGDHHLSPPPRVATTYPDPSRPSPVMWWDTVPTAISWARPDPSNSGPSAARSSLDSGPRAMAHGMSSTSTEASTDPTSVVAACGSLSSSSSRAAFQRASGVVNSITPTPAVVWGASRGPASATTRTRGSPGPSRSQSSRSCRS